MFVTDIDNPKFEGTAIPNQEETHPFECFYCPTHPGNKFQVLCTKENFRPSLMCVKCMIDPEILKHVKHEDMLPIHEIINKAASPSLRKIRLNTTKDDLIRKFSDFIAKDYVGSYDQHIKFQTHRLDREIESVKESLEELRSQFLGIFEKQSIDLRKREEELKDKFKDFIGEQEYIERLNEATLVDILSSIQRMADVSDYETFLRALHLRNSFANPMVENLHFQGLFSAVSNFRGQVNALRRCKIDTSKIEEIRKQIDSIEMLDKSLQALPGHIDLKLNLALDKVLGTEDKRASASQTPKYKEKPANLTLADRYYREMDISSESSGRKGLADFEFKDDMGYDAFEEDTEYHKTGGNSPESLNDEKTGTVPQGLYDWINRRVTGYLIFHNTIHDDESVVEEKEQDHEHLNHITGQKWRELSKLEREEYLALAMETRVKFKKQFEDLDLKDPDVTELQEIIDKKVKKVKLC